MKVTDWNGLVWTRQKVKSLFCLTHQKSDGRKIETNLFGIGHSVNEWYNQGLMFPLVWL